jgi:hypothetical protein
MDGSNSKEQQVFGVAYLENLEINFQDLSAFV